MPLEGAVGSLHSNVVDIAKEFLVRELAKVPATRNLYHFWVVAVPRGFPLPFRALELRHTLSKKCPSFRRERLGHSSCRRRFGVGPAVAVGEITYDGLGNTVATFTLNVNGNVQTNTDVTGTYTINSDCTGTSVEAGAHYSFVVSPDGNTTIWMETDAGTVVSGAKVRLRPTSSDDTARGRQGIREVRRGCEGRWTNWSLDN